MFALGAILCEILTGAPPFAGDDGGTFGRASSGETQPALDRLHAEGLDPGLVALACRCLSVDPTERPGDAGQLAQAIGDHQSGVEERLRQAELQRAAAEARVAAERGARRLLIGILAILLIGAVVAWIGWGRARPARAGVEARSEITRIQSARSLGFGGSMSIALNSCREAMPNPSSIPSIPIMW